MALPELYQVRLAVYEVDPEVDDLRRGVWAIVAPHMDAILDRYLDFQISFVPLRAEATRRNRAELKALHKRATERLFTQPCDERWVAEVEDRAKSEQSLGFGIRARQILNRAILSGMVDCFLRRHPLSAR